MRVPSDQPVVGRVRSKEEVGELADVSGPRFELFHDRWEPADERDRERSDRNRLELREAAAARVDHNDGARDRDHCERGERRADMTLSNKRGHTDCNREGPEITVGRGPRQAHQREQRQDDHVRVPRIDENSRAERSCEQQNDDQAERQSGAASSSPQHHADAPDRGRIHRQRARENPVSLRAEHPIRDGEHVEQAAGRDGSTRSASTGRPAASATCPHRGCATRSPPNPRTTTTRCAGRGPTTRARAPPEDPR